MRFNVYVDEKPILCRVTRAWIEDTLDDPESEEACLAAAKAAFDSITDEIG